MPFPPEEIETKRFVPAFRGYDRDEVDAFLRSVAADYRKLLQRRASQSSPDDLVIEIRVPSGARAPETNGAVEAYGPVQAELHRRVTNLRDLVARLNPKESADDMGMSP